MNINIVVLSNVTRGILIGGCKKYLTMEAAVTTETLETTYWATRQPTSQYPYPAFSML
jgi:hypothetical protein